MDDGPIGGWGGKGAGANGGKSFACVAVDDSWEQLSVSCLGAANGGIVNREAETGLIEALRQPGLLKRTVTESGGDADGNRRALDAAATAGCNGDDQGDVLDVLQRRVWQRLEGLNVRLTLLLASNVLSFVLGLWLGRRGGGVASNTGLPSELVIRS